MDVREKGWGNDRIHLAQDGEYWPSIVNIWLPQNALNFFVLLSNFWLLKKDPLSWSQ
jgi:hypothetical protein